MAFSKTRLYSVSRDRSLKAWNLEPDSPDYQLFECVGTVSAAHSDWILSVAIDSERLVTGGKDCAVKVGRFSQEKRYKKGNSPHCATLARRRHDRKWNSEDHKPINLRRGNVEHDEHKNQTLLILHVLPAPGSLFVH